MPLIQCPDCQKEISDSAPACINCGRPIKLPDHKPEEILPASFIKNKVESNHVNNPINSYWAALTACGLFAAMGLIFMASEKPIQEQQNR